MKPAIVLLHSSMSSKAQWAPLVEQLTPEFRCIPLDLLGYGAAPYPPGAAQDEAYTHTLAHEAEAIADAIAAQLAPDEAFHLVGHSFGGVCALHLARRMPRRVRTLTLFEPVAFHLLPERDAARVEIVTVVGGIMACASDRDATRIFIDYWNRPGSFDAAPASAQDKMIAQIAKVKLDFQALLGEPVALADLAALTMPALVLSGQHSPASTRSLAAQLASALPDVRARETRGGHMAPITHGDAVNPTIAAFLRGEDIHQG
ncbi:Pimeloyl-ACP methyl ester carboxylesterase [Duganella sp. CF517]|uniref:alpha/beta fold hydrolase n=1 Tax=Duganella sp. CF517 TaxID=1881038 RepID=UPI0008C9AAFC|nr:alpha/beta hydrolase [Duganella sp. CF517]SEN54253.1 Pimeloyl-ACP methyl ester carboxylesterase [Duganella sp. CF517]